MSSSPLALRNALLKERKDLDKFDSARAKGNQATAEKISIKLTTNKDWFASFPMESVSDAFTSVELKKVSREI